jgi:hypothetical protein
MISRRQKMLLKRAQREAALDDAEYRDAIEAVSGCRSSTDARLTDRHVDLALAFFEAIHWRKVDRGELQPSCKPHAIFQQRGYWAEKNPRQATSRDRFSAANSGREVAALEAALGALGFGAEYCAAIREKVAGGRVDGHAGHLYKAALARTLRAKQKRICEPAVVAG